MKAMEPPHPINEEPIRLAIAADARLCSPDYADDQIWELNPEEGDPRALSLQTTFGLRARSMRLFPCFTRKDLRLLDPQQFAGPVRRLAYYPNYLSLAFSPFAGVDVIAEYWAPQSHAVTGRLTLACSADSPEAFRLEWIGLLNPQPGGQSMAPVEVGAGYTLQGKTANLHPVCCLNGGVDPGAGPYPSLALDLELEPGETRRFAWALAALDDAESSKNLALEVMAQPWDAEIARLELLNAGQIVEIHSGNPDWDAAFALSQKLAYGLFFPGNAYLPHPSFVLSRRPDQGYSMRADGGDYPYPWSGQTPLDAWYLAGLLLPGNAELCKGVLHNFLSTQGESGAVDWRPGLGGQLSRQLAQPLLATLALQIDDYLDDPAWLADIYPQLLRFVQRWFEPDHDRDRDGFPEWDHPLQTGLEECPIYDRWREQVQGVDIATLESPALAAFLYRECKSLARIARRIPTEEGIAWLKMKIESLRREVESTWDKRSSTYRYRDYQSHHRSAGGALLRFKKNGKFTLRRQFRNPQRLQLHLENQGENTRLVSLTLVGQSKEGKVVEDFPAGRFFWAEGSAFATSETLFRTLQTVEVSGMPEGGLGAASSIDYTQEDVSLLLPLWAGIPTEKRARAILENTLLKRYFLPYGIPLTPRTARAASSHPADCVHLPWNQLLGEGLLAYGFTKAAANLVTRLMDGILPALKKNGAFRARFSATDAAGSGENNALHGLAPLGLFLQTLGIRRMKKNEVILQGNNPFPWPVTVKYQGMIITRHAADTVINFSTGQTITVHGAGPHQVSLS